MKLTIPPQSGFGILLRKPWWISALVALAIIALTLLALPPVMMAAGLSVSVPFIVIAGMAAWRQRGTPGAARIEAVREATAALAWPAFSQALQEGFEADGSTVKRLNGARADFALTRGDRVAIVGARRWKAARTGVEPLRDLLAETTAQNADECIYVTTGEISEAARNFARDNHIKLMTVAELARLLPGLGKTRG
jgi:restriction system protein